MKFGYLWTYGSEDALAQMRDSLQAAGCEKIFEDAQEPFTFAERELLQQALAEVTTGDHLVICELAALGAVRDVMAVAEQIERVGAGLQIIADDIDTLAPGGAMALRALKSASGLGKALRSKAMKARKAETGKG